LSFHPNWFTTPGAGVRGENRGEKKFKITAVTKSLRRARFSPSAGLGPCGLVVRFCGVSGKTARDFRGRADKAMNGAIFSSVSTASKKPKKSRLRQGPFRQFRAALPHSKRFLPGHQPNFSSPPGPGPYSSWQKFFPFDHGLYCSPPSFLGLSGNQGNPGPRRNCSQLSDKTRRGPAGGISGGKKPGKLSGRAKTCLMDLGFFLQMWGRRVKNRIVFPGPTLPTSPATPFFIHTWSRAGPPFRKKLTREFRPPGLGPASFFQGDAGFCCGLRIRHFPTGLIFI